MLQQLRATQVRPQVYRIIINQLINSLCKYSFIYISFHKFNLEFNSYPVAAKAQVVGLTGCLMLISVPPAWHLLVLAREMDI